MHFSHISAYLCASYDATLFIHCIFNSFSHWWLREVYKCRSGRFILVVELFDLTIFSALKTFFVNLVIFTNAFKYKCQPIIIYISTYSFKKYWKCPSLVSTHSWDPLNKQLDIYVRLNMAIVRYCFFIITFSLYVIFCTVT